MDFAAQSLQITNNRNTLLSKTHNELKLEACGKFSWFWLMKIYSLHCETFSLQPDIEVTLTGSTPIQQQHFTIIFLKTVALNIYLLTQTTLALVVPGMIHAFSNTMRSSCSKQPAAYTEKIKEDSDHSVKIILRQSLES